MNQASIDRLKQVHPALAERVFAAAAALRLRGIQVEVVQGLRTFAQQDALYAQGRTAPGPRVTNARGGQSNHNFGLAVDLCPIAQGRPNWETPASVWEATGAEAAGLEWGGRWKTIIDRPHVQLPTGLSVSDCLAVYNKRRGGLPAVWAEASRRLAARA